MNSGKYGIVEDFRKLFGSTDLTNSKDCILYRKYDAAQNVTHSIASTCNMNDPTDVGPNLDLIKAFICTDGKDWQTSSLENADDFTLSNLLKQEILVLKPASILNLLQEPRVAIYM